MVLYILPKLQETDHSKFVQTHPPNKKMKKNTPTYFISPVKPKADQRSKRTENDRPISIMDTYLEQNVASKFSKIEQKVSRTSWIYLRKGKMV